MTLTEEQIGSIVCGTEKIEYKDGLYHLYRYTDGQIRALQQAKSDAASQKRIFTIAGVRLSFVTDAAWLRVSLLATSIHPHIFCDILENGVLQHHIQKDTCCEETVEATLSEGEKLVEVFFPWGCPVQLIGVELPEGATVQPAKRKNHLVAYGDSITQGFYAAYPSRSYANLLARGLDAEIINKGFGGDCFFPALVDGATEDDPDFVTVAYGTNDWATRSFPVFSENCRGFMESLRKKYPRSRVFVITPLWRGKIKKEPVIGIPEEKMHDAIAEICKDYPEFTLIRGWDLVPHEEDCFEERPCLHPNDKGFAFYGENLLAKIKEAL